jgi:hypothetical protein
VSLPVSEISKTQKGDSKNMERISGIDQPCQQSVQDMLKSMFEKMSEDNKNLLKEMSENNQNLQINLEKKISENNQNLIDFKGSMEKKFSETKAANQNFLKRLDEFHLNIEKKLSIRIKGNNENEIDSEVESKLGPNIENSTVVRDEISSKEAELNGQFEKLADNIEEVDNMRHKVQVENDNCNEEILKRQWEKAGQLTVKSKDLQNGLLEGLNMTQLNELPEESSSICVFPTQDDEGIVKESTNEKTSNYKSICLFMKYSYNFITVIIDITLYERDRAINNDKMKRNKKCKRLEWCINVKEKNVSTRSLKEIM